MSARRRAHQPRPLIIAAAVYVLLAIAARSAVLLGLGLLVAIGAAAVWIDRRRAVHGPRGPRPGTRPPTIHAEMPRPAAQAEQVPARADLERQLADALARADALERRLADREAAAAAYVADLGALLADTQTELARERAHLAEARASAEAAWDAAADRPPSPRPRPGADARSALLAAPLSGARPLGGRHE